MINKILMTVIMLMVIFASYSYWQERRAERACGTKLVVVQEDITIEIMSTIKMMCSINPDLPAKIYEHRNK